MSSKGSLSGSESESSTLSPNGYLAHTMEYVVCETIPLSVSESSNSQNQYSCNICNTKKSQFQELRSHLFNHMGAIPYFCTLCNFADISLTQLYIHLLSHKEFLNDDEKMAKLKDVFNRMVYSCNLCFFSFKNNKDLATHYMKHITNSYKCKSCKFVFFTETELLIHAHIHSLSLVCRVCDKTFPSSQKVFLSHVLSHDYTRLYRNFPKIVINHQDVPFYKSFFEICSQVTNVEFPMYCGILKTAHKNLNKTKLPSPNEENRSSPVRIFTEQHLSSLGNNGNQEAIASSVKRRKSSTEESDLRPDVFKLPDYPWKKKSKTDLIVPDPEPNQAGIHISVDSVVSLRGRKTCLDMPDRYPSPLKGSELLAEEKKHDVPIINHASANQQVQNTEVFDTNNVKRNIKKECTNLDEACAPIPKCYISINYSNTSNNHLITDIKEEILDDTDEECYHGNELRSEDTTTPNGFNKFSIFSKTKDFVESSDVKDNSSMKDQDMELGISDKRRVSVLLERLPEEIVSVAKAESTMDMDIESPKLPAFCFKELLVVIPKLPSYVKDLASFRRYERKQNLEKIQTSTPSVVTRSRRQNSNRAPLEKSEAQSNVIKLNSESISIHNKDNTYEGVVDSSHKDTKEHLNCIETKRRGSSLFLSPKKSVNFFLQSPSTSSAQTFIERAPLEKSKDHIVINKHVSNVIELDSESISIHNSDNTSPYEEEVDSSHKDTKETSVNFFLQPPSTSSAQTLLERAQKGDLRTEDLDAMMDLDCSENLCEEGEDCCCAVSDCDTQSLDVEEDMNSIKNRIMLLKTALNSVQETSEED